MGCLEVSFQRGQVLPALVNQVARRVLSIAVEFVGEVALLLARRRDGLGEGRLELFPGPSFTRTVTISVNGLSGFFSRALTEEITGFSLSSPATRSVLPSTASRPIA